MNILSHISQGATASVYKASWVNDTNIMIVALKIIKDDSNGILKEALGEMSLLKILKHDHIIKLHDVVLEKKRTILILDYADMDLSYHIKHMPYSDLQYQDTYNAFMLQLCEAVAYCHEHYIIHCDIKPQNILIKNNQVKLADFGLSQKNCKKKSFNIVSLWYRAPEILLKEDYSYPIDVWSIGCVWSECLSGNVLYQGQSEVHQLELILKLHDEALQHLLKLDASERITCADLIKTFK